MKFQRAQEAATAFTTKVSDLTRSLTLSAIAVTWLAAGQSFEKLSGDLLRPLFVLAVALAFDFLQYLWLAGWWSGFVLHKQKAKIESEDEVTAPDWPPWLGMVLWTVKVLIFAAGFFLFLLAIYRRVPPLEW